MGREVELLDPDALREVIYRIRRISLRS